MVAGESGLGKTTFINTLFSTTIKNYADHKRRHAKQVDKTVEIEITKAELEEKFFKGMHFEDCIYLLRLLTIMQSASPLSIHPASETTLTTATRGCLLSNSWMINMSPICCKSNSPAELIRLIFVSTRVCTSLDPPDIP